MVLEEAIVFIESGVVELKPITILQVDAIRGALDRVSKNARGKLYLEPMVTDGAQVEICFSSNGDESGEDIFLSNSWCDELDPLLDLLREYAPKGDEIPSKKEFLRKYWVERQNNELPPDVPREIYVEPDYEVKSIEEWRAYPSPETDWWIVWPRLFLKKPAAVREVPSEMK